MAVTEQDSTWIVGMMRKREKLTFAQVGTHLESKGAYPDAQERRCTRGMGLGQEGHVRRYIGRKAIIHFRGYCRNRHRYGPRGSEKTCNRHQSRWYWEV